MKMPCSMTLFVLAALCGCGQTASRRAEPSPVAQHERLGHPDDERDDDEEDDDEEEEDDDATERDVAMADVPRAVMDAARAAFPAATWTSAEVEEEDGELVYELSGTLDGDAVEIEITSSGKVLAFEREQARGTAVMLRSSAEHDRGARSSARHVARRAPG